MSDRLALVQDSAAVRQRGRAAPRLRAGVALLVSTALALALLLPVLRFFADRGATSSPAIADGTEERARAAARLFLDRYVSADGRVLRPDQGGDTVSEGVSYALLLAQAAGDERTFAEVWNWADRNLRTDDGLLAFLWADGAVRDPNPASDADLVTAMALMRSGPRHALAGRELAGAVLARETVTRKGELLLAAGPWATGEPVTLNPSYWASIAYEELADRTGDPRWAALSDSSLRLTRSLTDGGRTLPPDWARVDGDVAVATPAPNGQAPDVRYGLNAQRLVVWLAASCRPAERSLAARFWPKLSQPGRAGALALWPDGSVADGRRSPMPLVAAAAAANAAGLPGERDRLLAASERVNAANPTYYGAAWAALGRVLLTTSLLGGCASQEAA
jgi:endo-1,4-beta-D-glucanase Y